MRRQLALLCAARHGDLRTLSWLADAWPEFGGRPPGGSLLWTQVFYAAAAGGHVEVLRWLGDRGYPFADSDCTYAVHSGQLEALKFLRARGCSWDHTACYYAAQQGHLQVLKYLRANGCPWGTHVSACAAESGRLEVLQYQRANGCPWDKRTCLSVAPTPEMRAWLQQQP